MSGLRKGGKGAREAIIRRVMAEFDVPRREITRKRRGSENLLGLITGSLAWELKVSGTRSARERLEKYLKFIPGFKKKYRRMKSQLQKQLVDSDA